MDMKFRSCCGCSFGWYLIFSYLLTNLRKNDESDSRLLVGSIVAVWCRDILFIATYTISFMYFILIIVAEWLSGMTNICEMSYVNRVESSHLV